MHLLDDLTKFTMTDQIRPQMATLASQSSALKLHTAIIDNYVDGKEFIRLSKEDIAKMVPPVGMANKIMRLQEKVGSKSVSMYILRSRCVYSLY